MKSILIALVLSVFPLIAQSQNSQCGTVVEKFKILPGGDRFPHTPICLPITYATNPPTSGRHYQDWAQYKTYSIPVAHGFLVHNLEHGAIVISYNCHHGCDEEVAALQAYLDGLPPDPSCEPEVKHRVVVVPDPELDVRFAAAAWGTSLKSECFDLEALGAFMQENYNHAPEDECLDGLDFEIPGLPPDKCGQPGFRWPKL